MIDHRVATTPNIHESLADVNYFHGPLIILTRIEENRNNWAHSKSISSLSPIRGIIGRSDIRRTLALKMHGFLKRIHAATKLHNHPQTATCYLPRNSGERVDQAKLTSKCRIYCLRIKVFDL